MADFQAQSGMSGDGRVGRWLTQAGMGKYNEQFAGLSEPAFRGLLMQDYGKYGVTSLEDKQRLFRLLKTVNSGGEPDAEPETPPKVPRPKQQAAGGIESFLSPELRADHGILDIHAMDDSDLFHEISGSQSIPDPFYKSPSPPLAFNYEPRAYSNGSEDEQFPVNSIPLPPTSRQSHRPSGGGNSNGSASARNALFRSQANNSSDDDYGTGRQAGEDRQPSTSDSGASLERWSHQEPQPRWGFVGCALKWIDTKIFQYNVTFGLYMLDRWERWLFNVCALSLLFAVGYSSYKIARPYSAALHESIEGLLKENKVPWQTNLDNA